MSSSIILAIIVFLLVVFGFIAACLCENCKFSKKVSEQFKGIIDCRNEATLQVIDLGDGDLQYVFVASEAVGEHFNNVSDGESFFIIRVDKISA